MRRLVGLCVLTLVSATFTIRAAPDARAQATPDDPPVANTQDPKDVPLTPEEARRRIEVPDGFRVSLFAGEPDVRQPIAMALDDRGRLWVAECYSYRTWKPEGNDRIVILEDTDHDGRFDKRKIFWSGGNYLTGLQLGFGGVWICNSPYLQFIPDRDGDDRPDGPPTNLLDGWSTEGVHNVLNGLTWGPDGWLYGCNGITAPSRVGKPGDDEEKRVEINCGIWRYHPTRHEFEVVAHGTTNPWGLDFDEFGQGFFTNCVIHHLFHLIPGARYKRMFGQDLDPHTYALMDSCADYLHWAGDDWRQARGGKGEHDRLGGGHAHAGAMIYLGDNWPDRYRGALFTCNIHGNRVNSNTFDRKGSGYAAVRAPDFLMARDPWFRGLELKYGPDGGVYVSDWTDLGECHDQDGVHRTSGRVYKVTYGDPEPPAHDDLARLDDLALVRLHAHANRWYGRHASRILQERAAEGRIDEAAVLELRQQLDDQNDEAGRLSALWTLHGIGRADRPLLRSWLEDKSEHLRAWSIRLLAEDKEAASDEIERFAALARSDTAPNVRLELAATMQRLPVEHRWPIAEALVARADDADDQNLPLMIWYGIEPLVHADRARALKLVTACRIPVVRQFIARRLAGGE